MRILVFLPNWVGDAVMATPALRAVRAHFAGAQIVGVMRPSVADVLEGGPWLDGRLVYAPRGTDPRHHTWPLVRTLRRHHFDTAVLLTNSVRTALVAWLGGVRRRLGYRRHGRGWLLTDRLDPPRARGRRVPSPAIDSFLRLAYVLGCPPESYRLELFLTERDRAAAAGVWKRHGLDLAERVILFNTGGAYGSAKAWPVDHFAALARRLTEDPATAVLVICGPGERGAAQQIAARANHPRVRSLAGEAVSIGLSKACVARAGLLVTTDSGPRHFAAAFQVPVVTLFGPTHIAWTETYFARAVHLQKKVDCGPCQLRECPLDHRCMNDLHPEEVYRSIVHLLQPPPQPVLGQLRLDHPPSPHPAAAAVLGSQTEDPQPRIDA